MLDDYWRRMTWKREDFERADLPVLYVTGWCDGEISGLLRMWRGMRARRKRPGRGAHP